MCTNNVRTLEDTHPGFWAKTLAPFAGHNSTGIGMHQPYKMQLVIEICGLPRVLFAAAVSAITRPFGIRGLFYKICGHGVAGIDGFYPDSSFEVYHTMGVINPEQMCIRDSLCKQKKDVFPRKENAGGKLNP